MSLVPHPVCENESCGEMLTSDEEAERDTCEECEDLEPCPDCSPDRLLDGADDWDIA